MNADPDPGDVSSGEVALLDELVADLQTRFRSAEDKDAPGLVGALLKALERRACVIREGRAPADAPGSIAAVTRKLSQVGGA